MFAIDQLLEAIANAYAPFAESLVPLQRVVKELSSLVAVFQTAEFNLPHVQFRAEISINAVTD